MKCLLCNKLISKNRKVYCSTKCIKRAWYIRNISKETKSYFLKNPAFWKTATGVGFKWEKWAARLLKAKHLEFNSNGADLNWNGKMVDVKCSNLYKRKFKRGKPVKSEQHGVWVFNKNKEKPTDYFFCICLVNNKPYKILLIPHSEFPKSGIVIGKESRYDKFMFKKDIVL